MYISRRKIFEPLVPQQSYRFAYYGLDIISEVKTADQPEKVILEIADRVNADAIFIGTNLYVGSSAKYLGPTIDYLSKQSDCPLFVVNL